MQNLMKLSKKPSVSLNNGALLDSPTRNYPLFTPIDIISPGKLHLPLHFFLPRPKSPAKSKLYALS